MKNDIRAVLFLALAAGFVGVASADTSPAPASAYAQEGLVACWDAIENVGAGLPHDNAATEWVDLKGGRTLTLASGDSFTDTAFTLGNTVHKTTDDLFAEAGNVTLEVNGRPTWKNSSYQMVVVGIPNFASFSWDSRAGGVSIMRVDSVGATQNHYITYASGYNDCAALISAGVNQTYSALIGVNSSAVYVNGVSKATTSGVNWSGNSRSSDLKVNVGVATAKSVLRSIRIYNRKLTATEIAINANIDKMRYDGADPASLVWPQGWRVRTDGVWEVKVSVAVVGGGSVSATEIWTVPGTTQTLTATPDSGNFVVWSGDTAAIQGDVRDAFANAITIKADAPVSLTATFADLESAKPTDFSADGVTGTFADRQLTITVESGKTCTYDYASTLASGWVTNVVKQGAGSITPAVASAYMGSFDFQEGAVTLNAAGQLGANNAGIVRKASGATFTSSLAVATGKKMYLAGTVKHNSWGTFVSSCDIVLTGNLTMSSNGSNKDVVVATGSRLDTNGHNLTVNTEQMLNATLSGMTVTNSNDEVASVISVSVNAKLRVTDGTSFWGGSRNKLQTSNDYANQGFTCSGTVGGDWTIISRGANFQAASASSANTLANRINCAVTVSDTSQWWTPTKFNHLMTDSCLTFGGPVTGTSAMNVYGGTVNFLNAANTYNGAMSLRDTKSSNLRSCIYLWNGANFSASSVALYNADIWMDDNTAFAFPAITLGNGTKEENSCTITGGPTGDRPCGRATIAGFTKSGGKTLTIDSPVHITGTTLVSTNTLALGSGTTADELPVFDHLSFADGTSFDMNGKNLTIADLTGIPTVTNPGTLTINGNWMVDGDAIVDGGKLDLGAGALVFGPSATITIVKGTKDVPAGTVVVSATGGITGLPTAGNAGMKCAFNVAHAGTELRVNGKGMAIIVR